MLFRRSSARGCTNSLFRRKVGAEEPRLKGVFVNLRHADVEAIKSMHQV